MFKPEKPLSAREQRRQQVRSPESRQLKRQFKLGHLNVLSSHRTGSQIELHLHFSKKELQEIGKRVMQDIFEVEEPLVKNYISQAQAQEEAFLSAKSSIDDLFEFSEPQYIRKLRTASEFVREFKERAYSYADNPLSLQLESYSLGMPQWLVARTRRALNTRYLLTLPPVHALFSILSLNPRGMRKRKEINGAVKRAITGAWKWKITNNVTGEVRELDGKVGRNLEQAYYTWLNGAVGLSRRFLLADWMDTVIAATRKVAEEGSPKAAYLYFTQLVRLFVPEGLDASKKEEVLYKYLGNISVQARNKKRLEMSTEIGKQGLDDVLAAIDLEERRTRYRHISVKSNSSRPVYQEVEGKEESPGTVYTVKNAYSSWSDLITYSDFSKSLRKLGASPKSAGELLVNVPIGQRKNALGKMVSEPGIVLFYEQLKPHDVDARSFMGFVSDFSNINVDLNGTKTTVYEAVRLLAVEGHDSGAAWLLRNVGTWSSLDFDALLELAKSPDAEEGMELYKRWRENPVRKHIISGIVQGLATNSGDIAKLALALESIPDDSLAKTENPTLEQLVSLQLTAKPDYAADSASLAIASPASGEHAFGWINLAYQGNLPLVDAMLSAYNAIPVHLRYRLKQLDTYVNEHVDASSREPRLMQYAEKISGMSGKLVSYLFRTDSFFDAFLNHPLVDPSVKGVEDAVKNPLDAFVRELEDAVKRGNPYVGLQNILSPAPEKQHMPNILDFLRHKNSEPANDVVIAEGVFYKMVFLGNFDGRKKSQIKSKLSDTGIEPVFVKPDQQGTLPNYPGVLVYLGTNAGEWMTHSGAAMTYYRNNKHEIRSVKGYGVSSLINAAIELRDWLVLNEGKNLSA